MRKKLILISIVLLVGAISISNAGFLLGKKNSQEHASIPKENVSQCNFNVKGMVCSACSQKIDAALTSVEGVYRVVSNHKEDEVYVAYDPRKLSVPQLEETITGLGYTVEGINTNLKVIDYSIKSYSN